MSAVVAADTADRFDSGSTSDERVKEQIYEEGLDWRVPEPDPEQEWRAAQRQAEQESNSQWRFGADPAYEQMRSQNRDAFRDPADIGGARPSGQIRFSW